ncbi:MAG TPA: peptide ABC transporter substrate-binding protein [Candidatus Baltobacteraceae bacterium]|nr:peptide ABC transporter substrate-binding protein [Candidatus Baltobacteraceae bacterium]
MRRTAAALLLCALLAACGSPAGSGAAGSPRAAGSIRFDLAADPTNLNPLFLHQDAASVEQQAARLAFLPFIDLDARGHLIPELLTRVPTVENGGISPDGRTITYHLRANVRWSDGVPVTSQDVLWTLHAIMDPNVPVPSREGYDLIDWASAKDAHTVVFHLKHAWAPAATTFFSYGFRPQFVLPAHVLSKQTPLARAPFNAAPSVGDGPYTFVSWKRGESLLYKANPLYWRGAPRAQRLDIRVIPDPQTNLVMLRSGSLDWNLIAPVQQQTLRDARGIAYAYVSTAVVAGAVFNLTHPPLDDVRVRRAIAMSIDREGISKKITLGRYPVTNVLQPQFSWAYDPSVKEPAYDPAAADSLLDSAGWKRGRDGMRVKNGKPFSIVYVQFPESMTGVRVATAIQAELRERGIAVEVKSVSNAQLFLPSSRAGTLASGQFDMAYVPFTMGSDPDDSSVLACNAPSNYMRYCNPRVDALESAALKTTSMARRKRIYARIERLVADDLPILYLFNADYIYAYRKQLRGFSPNAFLPTWNAAAWSIAPPGPSGVK